VLRDADQLHAEGAAFKFYNAEFKVDVYFAAPEERVAAPQDMAEVYLKTQVRGAGGAVYGKLQVSCTFLARTGASACLLAPHTVLQGITEIVCSMHLPVVAMLVCQNGLVGWNVYAQQQEQVKQQAGLQDGAQ
jgi:hypothetical protein